MSHARNKVNWCLRKGLKEHKEKGKHRGLIKIEPNPDLARRHLEKSEHYLRATLTLESEFSDISASTVFYSVYHSLLAIISKFGYESRNQECTFALIRMLEEDGKIHLGSEILNEVASFDLDEGIIILREKYQYGVELSMREELFNSALEVAKKLLGKVKEILEVRE
ncbi:MAG: hypothetical protein KJ905_02505 [Nanoarchaeota archaeon]|nr:hypothetical protein [Nanoarchaeota archaeon]MBU1501622.1 hypothetical protein [Nanoarchaeota archaeon]